jgi:hypothetical protein
MKEKRSLRVLGDRVRGRIFGPGGGRYQGSADNYVTRTLVICTPEKYCLGDQIEKNEMGKACSMNGAEKRRIHSFDGDTGGKETTLKTQV